WLISDPGSPDSARTAAPEARPSLGPLAPRPLDPSLLLLGRGLLGLVALDRLLAFQIHVPGDDLALARVGRDDQRLVGVQHAIAEARAFERRWNRGGRHRAIQREGDGHARLAVRSAFTRDHVGAGLRGAR